MCGSTTGNQAACLRDVPAHAPVCSVQYWTPRHTHCLACCHHCPPAPPFIPLPQATEVGGASQEECQQEAKDRPPRGHLGEGGVKGAHQTPPEEKAEGQGPAAGTAAAAGGGVKPQRGQEMAQSSAVLEEVGLLVQPQQAAPAAIARRQQVLAAAAGPAPAPLAAAAAPAVAMPAPAAPAAAAVGVHAPAPAVPVHAPAGGAAAPGQAAPPAAAVHVLVGPLVAVNAAGAAQIVWLPAHVPAAAGVRRASDDSTGTMQTGLMVRTHECWWLLLI